MLESIQAPEWSRAAAAHLLNRGGFGGSPREVDELFGRGPEGAVEWLLAFQHIEESFPEPACSQPDPDRVEKLRRARSATSEERLKLRREEQQRQRHQVVEFRHAWVSRMAATRRPLQERMVLFWHGHFATSIQKVRDPWLMYRQIALFRERATGHWPTLLMEVTRDPAMLLWLDQAQSRREHPNENYAREVMELFALGEGHYTEHDVLEMARSLTGLGYDRMRQEPQWRPRLHDMGRKTVLGQSGPLDPEQVIRLVAEHPQSGRFLARKLWVYFAGTEPSKEVVDGLAQAFVRGGRRVDPLLRTLFLSRAFHAVEVRRAQIKSPVQWLVMAVRQLERPVPRPDVVTNVLRELGQELLAPPNVKGWDGGVSWINTATLTRRQQYAALLTQGVEGMPDLVEGSRGDRLRERLRRRAGNAPRGVPGFGPAGDVDRLFGPREGRTRDIVLESLASRFLQSSFRPKLAEDVVEALGDDARPDPRAIRNAMRTVLQSTDYQLT